MTLFDIIQGLKRKEIKVNYNYHDINPLIRTLEWEWDHHLERKKEGAASKRTKTNSNFEQYWYETRILPFEDVKIGERIAPEHIRDIYCFNCDERHGLYLKSEKELVIISNRNYDQLNQKDEIIDCSCKAKHLVDQQMLTSEININNENLIFGNHFYDKNNPKTSKIHERPNPYAPPSINSILGRNELMQYLSTQNVGYGQMGNMSVTVYVADDKKSILVSTPYIFVDGYEEQVDHEGYTPMGTISLGVWCWMCADENVLKEHDVKLSNVNTQPTEDYVEFTKLNVIPGKWKVEHYYEFSKENDPIYSKMYLIEKT